MKNCGGMRFAAVPFIIMLALSVMCAIPVVSDAAEKAARKPVPKEKEIPKEPVIDDSTLDATMARALDLLKKGNQDAAVRTFANVNEYAKEVLATVRIVRKQYDRVANDSSTGQSTREEMIIKLKQVDQLISRYTAVRNSSGYYAGYIHAKKGETEKARHYLGQVLETTPFSLENDSMWMRTKALLLSLYNLGGEF